MQEPLVEIDLQYDRASVYLTVVIAKETKETVLANILRDVSRAFAETEGLSVDSMHTELEHSVQGFESESQIVFVWERRFNAQEGNYPQRLANNLGLAVVAQFISMRVH